VGIRGGSCTQTSVKKNCLGGPKTPGGNARRNARVQHLLVGTAEEGLMFGPSGERESSLTKDHRAPCRKKPCKKKSRELSRSKIKENEATSQRKPGEGGPRLHKRSGRHSMDKEENLNKRKGLSTERKPTREP